MASSFMALVYASLKASGIDTSKMTPDEAVKKFNELNDKESLKKEEISKNKYFVEKIDRSNQEELKSKIESYSNRIVKDNKEHHILIDKNGCVYEKVGNENAVGDFGLDVNNSISIHNHLENGSFESDDFTFYRDKLKTEFLCVTPKYIYKLMVLKQIDKPYNYFYIRGVSNDSQPIEQPHNVMEYMQKEGYVKYERNARNP